MNIVDSVSCSASNLSSSISPSPTENKKTHSWGSYFSSWYTQGSRSSSSWSSVGKQGFSRFMRTCFATCDEKTKVNSLAWVKSLNKGTYSLPELKRLLADLKLYNEAGGEASSTYLFVQEVLAKKIAYNDFNVGEVLHLPYQDGEQLIWVDYRVEQKCSLDKIPAYGLVSSDEKAPNILLFRGTTFPSYKALLKSEYALETWKADTDARGVGVTAFNKGKYQINAFLNKNDKPNHIIGHSLGGAFSNLTGVHFADRVEKVTTFNAPMVGRALKSRYDDLEVKPDIQGYCCRHDVIKLLGGRYLLGKQFELHGYERDLDHHCDLVCLSNKFFKREIDVEKVNKSRLVRTINRVAQNTLFALKDQLKLLFKGLEGIRHTYQDKEASKDAEKNLYQA